MNTSQYTQLLSAEQLDGFLQNKLPAEEMKRVQHLLDDCELSREALEGYTFVPGAFADVEGLKKSIAKKSGMNSLNWATISLGIVAIAVISILINVFYKDETPVVADNSNVVITQPGAPVYTEPVNSLSPVEDHFVNPEAKVVAVTVPGETKVVGNTVIASTEQAMVVEPIPVDHNKHLIVDSVPVTPKKVETAYNAQVGFLVNLKITEYDKYYTTQTIEVKEIPLTGTPADKENKDDPGNPDEEETVRSVPADQFLREGLIAFRDGRYGKCVSKMEVLLDHNPDDINALFYTAVSYVKLEMYSKAIPLLDKIITAENNVFDEEAEWYKALALEGNGDTVAANELFKKIADAGGFYSKQASAKLK